MLGDSMKISPRIDPKQENNNMTAFKSYFPKGIWRDLNNWTLSVNASLGGKWVDLPKMEGTAHIHLKEGKIIPQ